MDYRNLLSIDHNIDKFFSLLCRNTYSIIATVRDKVSSGFTFVVVAMTIEQEDYQESRLSESFQKYFLNVHSIGINENGVPFFW